MMNDFDVQFFSEERWKNALSKGLGKDIRIDQLIQLAKPEVRIAILNKMHDGTYRISPPHVALIPKDTPGEFRSVYVNEPADRVILSIANDILFEMFHDMIHPSCKSYQKGIGCGKVVQKVSLIAENAKDNLIGWKSDLSKYFDSVPIRFIDGIFDEIERRIGKSIVLNVVRAYYHCDIYFDEYGNLCEKYQSLKQGCAVAAFLADVVIRHIDEKLSALSGFYVRYSDDMIYLGEDHEQAMDILTSELEKMDMKLNPKKVEALFRDKWFKFLGYSIKGRQISLSRTRLAKFQKEIESRTTKNYKNNFKSALHSVMEFLYVGDGEHSWATQVLPVINVKSDIDTLNGYVMDSLRAVQTDRRGIGGLGYCIGQKDGCIMRGHGRNVTANRQKTEKFIEGYRSLGCMRKTLMMTRNLYDAIIRQL